jgi:mono/diheme cytochrome c family protein
MLSMRTTLALLILLSPLLVQDAGASARRGEAIAKKHCATCHAIGRTGQSAHPKAPPLRTLAAKYPLETLEEAFAEGIMVSHDAPEMPAFEMEPRQIDDLIAYLKSLQRKKR